MNSDLVSREAAAKAVCLFCAVPEFYGPPKEVEGSKRLWHSDLRNSDQGVVQCSAASIIALPAAHPCAPSSTEAQKCVKCHHDKSFLDAEGRCSFGREYHVNPQDWCGHRCVFSAGAESAGFHWAKWKADAIRFCEAEGYARPSSSIPTEWDILALLQDRDALQKHVADLNHDLDAAVKEMNEHG